MAASILGWVVAGAGNAWSQKFLNFDMSKQESKNTFDGLVSVTDVYMEGGVLSRIPSIRKMRSLKVLSLDYNKITAVEPGDFAGAAQLVVLTMAGNQIVSVAAEAFRNLALYRVEPAVFRPTNANGTQPYQNAYGIGTCFHGGYALPLSTA